MIIISYFCSGSLKTKVETNSHILLNLFSIKQLKYLLNSSKYNGSFFIRKDGSLYGFVSGTSGYNEEQFICKINVNIPFKYSFLFFSKTEIEDILKH